MCFATSDFLLHRSRLSVWGIRAGRVPISRRDVIYVYRFRINRPSPSTYNGSRNLFQYWGEKFRDSRSISSRRRKINFFAIPFPRLLILWNGIETPSLFIVEQRRTIDVSDFSVRAENFRRISGGFWAANRWILRNGVASFLETFLDREKIKACCTTYGSSKGRPKRKNVRAWTIFLEIIVDIGYAMFHFFFPSFILLYFIYFFFFIFYWEW